LLQGSKVFCLQFVNMATIDIPQGGSMARYLERNDVKAAYQVACLGVTEADWKSLAQAALQVRAQRVAWMLWVLVTKEQSAKSCRAVAWACMW
jgi:intraflagellar transport protein 122